MLSVGTLNFVLSDDLCLSFHACMNVCVCGWGCGGGVVVVSVGVWVCGCVGVWVCMHLSM